MIRVEETFTYEIDASGLEEAEEIFQKYMQGDEEAEDRVTFLDNIADYYKDGERL